MTAEKFRIEGVLSAQRIQPLRRRVTLEEDYLAHRRRHYSLDCKCVMAFDCVIAVDLPLRCMQLVHQNIVMW